MPNKTLTFKTDILPYSDGEYNIGNSSAKWKVNGYVISDAAGRGVDTVIVDRSSSLNLPTSAAVASFIEEKGYITTYKNTTYTLTQDGADGHKLVFTPSEGDPVTITIPDDNTDTKVMQNAATTADGNYPVILGSNVGTAAVTDSVNKSSTLTYNPRTKALVTGGTVDGYELQAASAKPIDVTIGAGSSSTNLPTSAAVASFVEGKGYLASTLKGAANGLAELDENGKILSSQLPSFVDEVREYPSRDDFPLTGMSGLIYVDEEENQTYRWSGSEYVQISSSLALGTTASTAFRGDYGDIGYQHATDSNKLTAAQPIGLYKISTTAEGHIKTVTPVIKNDIMALGVPATDTKVTQEATINTDDNYPILIAKNTELTAQTDTVNKTSTLTYNPATKELMTNGTVDGFKLAAASAKNVTDNMISTAPSVNDVNLITGRTLYNSIIDPDEIDDLFPGQNTYSDFATAAEIAALFN